MKSLFLGSAAAAAFFTAGAAFAQTAQQPSPAAQAPQREEKVILRSDAQAQVGRLFSRLDANHDGFVTSAEIDAAQAQREAAVQQRAERLDPAKIFDRLDSNKDGKITPEEAEAAHTARAKSTGGEPAKAHAVAFGGMFGRADTNKDGVVTRAEFDAVAQQHATMREAGVHRGFSAMFDRADANKDGRVSLAEAQQLILQHFDQADLNHDGKLTPEERREARQQLRGQRQPS